MSDHRDLDDVGPLREKAFESIKKVDRVEHPDDDLTDEELKDLAPLALDLMTFVLFLQGKGQHAWTGDDLAKAALDYTGE